MDNVYYVLNQDNEKEIISYRIAFEEKTKEINVFNDNTANYNNFLNYKEQIKSVFYDTKKSTIEYHIIEIIDNQIYITLKFNKIEEFERYYCPKEIKEEIKRKQDYLEQKQAELKYDIKLNKYRSFLLKNNIKETFNMKGNGFWLYSDYSITNKDDLKFLCNKIAKAVKLNINDCLDNERFACCNNQKQIDAYNDIKNNGCCGFYDEIWKNELTGNSFMFGYNYGH